MRKLGTIVVLMFATILAVAGGCARTSGEPVMFTGKTVDAVDMRETSGGAAFCGKLQYAEVNSAWLAWAYDDFRAELSAGQFGVVKWDDRAECTFFASSFEVFCQKRYFAQAFRSAIPAPGIAVGTMWFVPAAGQGHAINLVLTEIGRRFFEPQTGKFLDLTPAQIASAYYRKFD